MKQKDIVLIIVIIFVSTIVSFVVSGILINPSKNRQTKVQVAGKIDSNFPAADNKYFNNQALDPTQLVKIGNSNNSSPFNGATQ